MGNFNVQFAYQGTRFSTDIPARWRGHFKFTVLDDTHYPLSKQVIINSDWRCQTIGPETAKGTSVEEWLS